MKAFGLARGDLTFMKLRGPSLLSERPAVSRSPSGLVRCGEAALSNLIDERQAQH